MPTETAAAPHPQVQDAEAQAAPEKVSPERQQNEINRVASNLLYRTITEASEKTPNQQSQGERAILSLKHLGEGNYKTPVPLSGDHPLQITVDGRTATITHITGGNEDALICTVNFPTATGEGQKTQPGIAVSRVDMVNAQLVAETDAILGHFDGPQKALIKMYIDMITNSEEVLGTMNPQEVNRIISEAATSANIITIDDIQTFVDKTIKSPVGDTEEAMLEQQKVKGQLEKIAHALDGKNLADPQTMIVVLETTGLTQEKLAKNAQLTNDAIVAAQKAVDANPQDLRAKDALEYAKLQAKLQKRMRVAMKEDGPLQQYFESMNRGEVNEDVAAKVIESLRTGDLAKIMQTVTPELDNDPEKDKKRAELVKKLGGGSLILLILTLLGAEKVFKDIS